jgi:GT2 family glycosyltransferase
VPAPELSILLLTFGAREWVERSVAAVHEHTDVPYELIVVDNASPDDTAAWITEHAHADVFEPLAENTGFAAGMNLAANRATAPAVCLLNSDAMVPADWARPLLDAVASDGVGAAAPLYVDLDGRVEEAGCNVDADGTITPLRIDGDPADPDLRATRPVQHASAACMVIRTDAFRRIGGLDCGYGLAYYEDVDFVFTLRAAGWQLVLVPTVHVVHAHARSSPDRSVADALVARNRPRFVARHQAALAHRHHAWDAEREPHRDAAARDALRFPRTLLLGVPAEPVTTGAPELVGVVDVVASGTDEELVAALTARLFHYDHVVTTAAIRARVRDGLTTTQPQAEIVVLDDRS